MTGDDRDRAAYNPSNSAARKLIETTIPVYNKQLGLDMIFNTKQIVKDCSKISSTHSSNRQSISLQSWTIAGAHGESAYFTLKFAMPVIQYIPSYFKPLHQMFSFTKHNAAEYIPCYIMNLNHVALVKTVYQHKQAVPAYGELGDGIFNKAVYEGGRHMELSSSNILLSGSTKNTIQTSSHDIIRRCFELCHWRLPASKNIKDTSTIHNLVYHRVNSVLNVLQLRKTLLRIIKIKKLPSTSKGIVRKNMKWIVADVAMLVYDRDLISSEFHRNVFLAYNEFQTIKDDDILNVITVKDVKDRMLLIVGHTGSLSKADIKPLLNVVLWKLLQRIDEDSSITKAGNIHEISDLISNIVENNSGENDLFYPSFVWNLSIGNIKKSITELYPLYMLHDDVVHQLSPTMLSFIMSTSPSILEKKETVQILINLLDILKINAHMDEGESHVHTKNNTLRTMSQASKFPDLFLKSLPNIVNRMAYSRIFSRY